MLEARPKGPPEGSAIENYVVERFKTRQEAIRKAILDWSRACGT